ncbi:hypothetical protein GCM10007989_10030 [Devosia pacifica]|uniref:SH3b domain-containing protein n=1 Tax=Devosia pacifica TaxID=1335967 RepID=A0A918VR27_9HYPH|nr:SH3 domain-containing protein [Devosia pacifica]GHA16846.1 hypothetical protein GCM10007989_10030 [Devosia pacifica]
MHNFTKVFTGAAAMAVTMLATSAAYAAPAQATTAVNVRSGPGTNYSVVDVLQSGQRVEIDRCSGNWCYVIKPGPDGWTSSRYLARQDENRDRGRDRDRRSDRDGRPDVNFSVELPGFEFSIGNGADFRQRPDRDRGGRVCFYEDWNYRGSSFCVRPGQRYSQLNNFNDRISSIRVYGNAQAQVCEDYNYNGRCAVVSDDRPRLQGRNNDIISSIRVR